MVEWDKGVGLKDFCKIPGFVLHDIFTKNTTKLQTGTTENVIRSEDYLWGRCF